MSSQGILYFLVNPSMPGLVKIGRTTGELSDRLQQLSSTGVPAPFEVVAAFYVRNSQECEAAVHKKLMAYRDNPKREFFSASVDVLIQESIGEIAIFLDGLNLNLTNSKVELDFIPDKDDISFMFYLLHDCYQQGTSYSSEELAEHHCHYTPIELEIKLMMLEEHEFIKRVNKLHEGMGCWSLMPKGLRFMIENNHHDKSLL